MVLEVHFACAPECFADIMPPFFNFHRESDVGMFGNSFGKRVCLFLGTLWMLMSQAGMAAQGVSGPPVFKQVDDLEVCVQHRYDADECLSRARGYIEKHPREALATARLVRRNFKSFVALSFFEDLVKRREKAICTDEDLSLAVLSGLALPGDYPDAARARAMATGFCRAELEPAVIKEVSAERGSSYLKDNACPILQKAGKAPESCRPEITVTSAEVPKEVLPKLDKSKVALEAGKAYRGSEGEVVTMVPIEGSDLFLVRFEGIRGPWNGKTILHRREERGNDNADFWTEHRGARWNAIVQRGGYEVYVPEYKPGKGFIVSYSEQETKTIVPKVILDSWMP